jgi:hypothetical protein
MYVTGPLRSPAVLLIRENQNTGNHKINDALSLPNAKAVQRPLIWEDKAKLTGNKYEVRGLFNGIFTSPGGNDLYHGNLLLE